MERVALPKELYEELLDTIKLLNCLYAVGLSDWEGYSVALEMYRQGNKETKEP